MSSILRRGLLVAATAAALVLSACGSPAAPAAPATSTAPAPTSTSTSGLTVTDAWVKPADAGMTAVFGTLTATGGPVTVVSAATSASPRTELHEVVMNGGAMTMRPKEGGFVVDPAAAHELKPGGDHVMVMDLASPIRPGDQVRVTFTLAGGGTVEFTALAKETTGGEETYADHAGMNG
ncbi:copper chaperone PCu(A)C [Pseudonocardia sp. N23]|uniref:copper chaperone PCu(A)C n=1 Tax=Pseudonocardia sp. N23 TaxID=1987376 RepID=UPI000BFE29A7|nr:copper chaperone PCu(A)C [Pseudonocardia sp. N23]GAY12455.1 copper metallochaperone, bacterial analog of Cox17 protein [Pseudonocardia sp. N23]